MSVASASAPTSIAAGVPPGGDRRLRRRQWAGLLRLELRKNLHARRAWVLVALALLPVVLTGGLALGSLLAVGPTGRSPWPHPMEAPADFAIIFEILVLQVSVFFGCAWLFVNLVRGEIVDRCLHYYLLTPLPRGLLALGKYSAGVIAAFLLFGAATLASLAFLGSGPGLAVAAAYLGVVLLACLAYGALFLLLGLRFRNPVIPALIVYGWEQINFLLPPVLQKISVLHYLHALMPVPTQPHSFAFLAPAGSPAAAIVTLLVETAVFLFLARRLAHGLEISYAAEE